MKTPDTDARRILVVEDEPGICTLCRRVLTGEGFEVEIAVNGKVAQEVIVDEAQYTLVLIDIRTPAMNGMELYQWLQEEHPALTEMVVFTSGSVMGGDTMAFVEQTGRPFLPKPFTPEELTAIVRETLKEIGR